MELLNALVAGLVVGGAYALLALGVSLIFSTTGVLNFAQAAFAMLAAYVYSWATASRTGRRCWPPSSPWPSAPPTGWSSSGSSCGASPAPRRPPR